MSSDRQRVSDMLATAVDKAVAQQIADLHGPWRRKRREQLRVHVLDAIVSSRITATARPYTAEELGRALNQQDGRSPR